MILSAIHNVSFDIDAHEHIVYDMILSAIHNEYVTGITFLPFYMILSAIHNVRDSLS